MTKILKWTLVVLGAGVAGVVGLLGSTVYAAKQRGKEVKEMADTPVGTSVEDVMAKVRSLRFSEQENVASALGQAELEVFEEREGKRERVSKIDDALTGIEQGVISLGKVGMPPFERFYCEITFRDRRVTGTRFKTLD